MTLSDFERMELLKKRDYYRAKDPNHPKLKAIEDLLRQSGWHEDGWPKRDPKSKGPQPPKE
jgi:hypothetical protein